MALAIRQSLTDTRTITGRIIMETVKRIIDWFSTDLAEQPADRPEDEVVFEIDTLEDAARIAMGSN